MKIFKKKYLTYSIIFVLGAYSGIKYNEWKHKNDIIINNKDVKKIDEAWSLVNHNFVQTLNNKNQKEMLNGAIKGMLQGIDPHSVWWEEGKENVLKEKLSGNYGGIGIVYQFDEKENVFKVKAVKKDGPADKAGIKQNNIIISIDNISSNDKRFSQLFKGAIGSEVLLKVKNESGIKEYKIKRDKIDGLSVYSTPEIINNHKWINIKINDFEENTVNELASEIRDNWYNIKQDNGGIILDLRSSPGGLVDVSAGVASLFIDKGKNITTIHTRNEKNITFNSVLFPTEAWSSWAKTVPMVIWVDDKTASAAEILTAALKDNKRTKFVIGTPTFGKGSVQQTFSMDNKKEQATFTVGFYKTPNNNYLQDRGVIPDILLKYPENIEKSFLREKDIPNTLVSPENQSNNDKFKEIDITESMIKQTSIDDIYKNQTEIELNIIK